MGGHGVRALRFAPACDFEKRITLQFVGDIGLDLQIRQREQLYCLLQLGRHHQRLALTQVEAWA